ncbi:hypothetical protein LWI28_024879 [Acer negundo]|uniref:Uncharacterized protein n=1 Tax=Acer negundo TaxID=4023 RepID=A0AAD5JRE5_ACENE|nr:hypothetical protein LWI28_024879 [Acer negundo]
MHGAPVPRLLPWTSLPSVHYPFNMVNDSKGGPNTSKEKPPRKEGQKVKVIKNNRMSDDRSRSSGPSPAPPPSPSTSFTNHQPKRGQVIRRVLYETFRKSTSSGANIPPSAQN